MERNPKRARKKEARDARAEAVYAAWRRRRIARVAGVVVVIGAVAALMLYATRDPGDQDREAAAQPTSTEPAGETPCPQADAPRSDPQQYESGEYPPLADGEYSAVIETTCGDIEIDLFEDRAPETIASFVFLAREGYFDGLTWHRVVGNFVIQTGDPDGANGQEPDGPGYTIPDELEGVRDQDYTYGTVAMANVGQPDSGGSQFFIVVHDREGGEPAGLDPAYTIFGRVERRSFEVIDAISRQPTTGGTDPVEADQPRVPVYIESIEIRER